MKISKIFSILICGVFIVGGCKNTGASKMESADQTSEKNMPATKYRERLKRVVSDLKGIANSHNIAHRVRELDTVSVTLSYAETSLLLTNARTTTEQIYDYLRIELGKPAGRLTPSETNTFKTCEETLKFLRNSSIAEYY